MILQTIDKLYSLEFKTEQKLNPEGYREVALNLEYDAKIFHIKNGFIPKDMDSYRLTPMVLTGNNFDIAKIRIKNNQF